MSTPGVCYCGAYGGGAHTKSAKCDKWKTKGHVDNPYVAEIAALTQTVAELRAERERLRAALQRIAKWEGEFPSTGEHWPDGSPISYVAQYGSNGERDYMRAIAATALASPPAAEEPSTKGRYGAECNRASCHNVPATWKHRDIPRHYCQPCGMWINENNSDCDPPLCGPVTGDAK